jgi:hypothetical protein
LRAEDAIHRRPSQHHTSGRNILFRNAHACQISCGARKQIAQMLSGTLFCVFTPPKPAFSHHEQK